MTQRNVTAAEWRTIQASRKAKAPAKVKYVCIGNGEKACYKAGHKFSDLGMFGNEATLGHIALKGNEDHAWMIAPKD